MLRMRWPQPALLSLALLLGPLLHGGQAGAEGPERFAVRNAFVELTGDQWQLQVSLDLELGEAALAALHEGIPLTLRLEAEAHSARRLLPDEKVAVLERQWQLGFDALANRYVVSEPGSATAASFTSADEALAALARPGVLPLAATSQLPPAERFDVRVRAIIDVGDVPAAVRLLLFWRSFSQATEWYTWTVRP